MNINLIKISIFLILLLAVNTFAQGYELNSDTKITIGHTEITGTIINDNQNRKIYGWFGLPFAQPPLGDLRWRAPRNFEFDSSDFNASKLPNRCMQVSNAYDAADGIEEISVIGSEDCLYLNVFAPEEVIKYNKKIPVLFWIHGGGNTWGHSASSMYIPKKFLEFHDVILVTTNYRLGPLGWLSLPGLNIDSEEPLDQSSNFGTLDLIKSLEWVNRNIENFGGDPDNITIFGESAGGRNVMSLMATPQSKELFERGIAQSGYLGSDSIEFSQNDPRAGSISFLKDRIKLKNPNISNKKINEFIAEEKKVSDFLRSLTSDEVIRFYRAREDLADSAGLIDVPNLIPDGIIIPKNGIYNAFKDGNIHDKAMIFGSNRDENKLFMYQNEKFVKFLPKFITKLIPFFKDWSKPLDPEFYDIYAKYQAQSWKYGAVDLPARFMSNDKSSAIYAYRFDWDEEPESFFGVNLKKLLGAAHAFEIDFIFNSPCISGESSNCTSSLIYDEANRETDVLLSKEMSEYWVNFAYDGDPNSNPYKKTTIWNEWNSTSNNERFIVFDSVDDKGIVMFKNTLSGDSILQNLASENISVEKKCYILSDMIDDSTLTQSEIKEIYNNFLNRKCIKDN